MKTITFLTYWTTEQAEDIYLLLDEMKSAIWQSYGEDIVKMRQEITYQEMLAEEKSKMNDELPF
ncbi:MAG TPA: hypothetical protein EYG22_00950 [Candidatus Thioglobus sp.]|nr:hypothetical protein [Candidatus Thioglobus sp.]